ncbi:MAG: ABC transporter ATP-binding protein/permease [Candidatus Adiutrix intracellularis]|jgi:subfamily B ATP-binding cassette protein MsbA|nr:ABC transporter ATP-binding protein/permease [Candidatus Adiutrix intracellularis]
MSGYFKLLKYVQPYAAILGLGLICLLGASAAQLYLPLVIRDIIDYVFVAKDRIGLNLIALSILIIYVFRGFCVFGQNYLMEYVAQRVVFVLRDTLFKAMVRLRGLAYFEKKRTGGLMSYYVNDIGVLQNTIVGPGMDFIREFFILIGSLTMMIHLHWRLALILFISVPFISWSVKKLGRRIKRAGSQVLDQLSEFTVIMQEILSGIRVVKSFAREDYEIGRFLAQMEANFKAIMKVTCFNAILTPVIEFLATAGISLIIWYGGREVIDGRLSPGALTAFLAYAINLSNPIKRLSRAYGSIQQGQAACERVFEALNFEPEVKDSPEAIPLPPILGEVRFENLSFSYEPGGQEVLKALSFIVHPGQMVALVGPSGAGKTTLVNLILRFYDVTEGAVLIDGWNLRSVTQRSLRGQVGIVPQETLLFSGSIYDNIRYGRLEATAEDILNAARTAHITEFTDNLTGGLDTLVGERGLTLSGGQRQRVAIARAILKDPRILILDEATSALDVESERLVRDALALLLKGRTSFIIAHRLSTIYQADVILVLNRGRLAEFGCHQELLAKNGLYASLYYTQFKPSETI